MLSMSEFFAMSAENAVVISLHTTKQDVAARLYAEKARFAVENQLVATQQLASERKKEVAEAEARHLATLCAKNR